MLGEIIAQEIQSLEEEKNCNCHHCMGAKALRAAILYREQARKCPCPVCTLSLRHLRNHCMAPTTYLDHCADQERQLDDLNSRLIITPDDIEQSEGLRLAIEKNSAAAIVLAQTVQNLIIDSREMTRTAHQTFNDIQNNTVELIAQTAESAAATIIGNISRSTPTDVN